MLEHGGHVIEAAKKYNIPRHKWIDLSTGINPNGWPIPVIPAKCWQRLPETEDALVEAAKQYYQCQTILPVAGSQAAIQALPKLRSKSTVGVLKPTYSEHAYCWKNAGHKVVELQRQEIESQLDRLDVLILVNPNNPTGECFERQQLLEWLRLLNQRKGWLIIDEAFMDTTPEYSLAGHQETMGLIVLRSIGKFFGLAGIRCGFVIAAKSILDVLNEKLGPWTISHPSRFVATAALLDMRWHRQAQYELKQNSARLASLLTEWGLKPDGSTDLFQWIKDPSAKQIQQNLAQQGILTRLFDQPLSLRFGLPRNNQQYSHLISVLSNKV